jgi:hypothetical protein
LSGSDRLAIGLAGESHGGAHQVPWYEDPIILDRIQAGLKPWLERRSPFECLDLVNKYMAEAHPHEPEVSLRTMSDDRRRAQTLTITDLEALRQPRGT